jgi:type IV secretion system protein VirB8
MLQDLAKKILPKAEDANQPLKSISSWYNDKYDRAIVQRNILFILFIIAIFAVILSNIALFTVSKFKNFEPFVIQIEQDTGKSKIVNPIDRDFLTANESMTMYLIKRYVNARESYNPVDFETQARGVVRLLSNPVVYRQYISYITVDANNPVLKYGKDNSTYVKFKSITPLVDSNNKYVVRFAIYESDGKKDVHNKIAIVEYKYLPMQLSPEDMEINPVGFQVVGYRVDEDNS